MVSEPIHGDGWACRIQHQLPLLQVEDATARAAAFGSCVTMMIVLFNWLRRISMSVRISSALLVSRSPVGSSATMSVGIGDHSAGDADALLLAAGELPRAVAHAIREPHQFEGRFHLLASLFLR